MKRARGDNLGLLRRLGAYFAPYTGKIIFSLACMAVVGGTAGTAAWLVKPVLDDIFIQHNALKLKLIPLLLLSLYAFKGVCRYAQSYIMRWVGGNVILQMREDVMANFQRRDVGFFEGHTTGHLLTLVITDVNLMQRAVPDLVQMVRTWFTVAGLMVVLFGRDWKLALIAVTIFPLAAWPVRRISTLMRSYSRRTQEETGELMGIIQETFSGIHVVKTFRAEERELGRFHRSASRLLRLNLKRAKVQEVTGPLMELLGATGAALIIWYGGHQVLRGQSTPGEFFSFLTALFMAYDPLKQAGKLMNTVQAALASAERVFGAMDLPVGPSEVDGEQTLEGPVREVEFRDVVFRYGTSERDVLQGVNLHVRGGQIIAFVGLSGGGKSTVLKLLPRFYDPTAGTIAINGVDLRNYTVGSLRDSIAMVTQDTFLFNDTIRSNILLGRPGATEAEVVAAAQAAHAHDFITATASGYDTVVGQRGELLSGGQRQRIAIARAILKNAPILLLDEATSALDSESEKAVQQALDVLMRGRTSFVIAHRLSTVTHADLICVIEEGRIVESGRHEELLGTDGPYARLCRLQFLAEEGEPTAVDRP